LIVPEQALVPIGKDRFVYRLADGKAVLTKIELGLRRPGEVEIRSGLSAGDAIVVDGQLRLRDGAAVTVVADKPPPQVAADDKKQKAN
jgi:membrane fusion protein (multidrug efflux system)